MFVFSKEVADLLKFKLKQVYVDNTVFRFHYRLTFIFLMVSTVLVCTRQYIGEHINCIADSKLDHVINTYCFFMTTYTVTKHHNATAVAQRVVPHPGVGPHDFQRDPVTRVTYYQWVPFVLFLQAICFYLPHLIWKTKEKGRVKALVTGMKGLWLTSHKEEDIEVNNTKIDSSQTKANKLKTLKKHFFSFCRFHINKDWAMSLCLCELLNAINVVLQIYLTDLFLGGKFWTLGRDWNEAVDKTPLLDEVFPKVTKCTFYKYGSSGTLQRHDALCVMALNIVNEKIFCILWFWYLILFSITALGLLWRLCTFVLYKNIGFNMLVWLNVSPGPALDTSDVATLSAKFTFSDWLFFYYVGKNIDGALFRALLAGVADDLRSQNENVFLGLPQPPSNKYYSRPTPSPVDEPNTRFIDDPNTRLIDEPDYESNC